VRPSGVVAFPFILVGLLFAFVVRFMASGPPPEVVPQSAAPLPPRLQAPLPVPLPEPGRFEPGSEPAPVAGA